MTLEDFFREANKREIIDFHLRTYAVRQGVTHFYIHCQNANGATLDFKVVGDTLEPLPHNTGAYWHEADYR